MYDKGPSIAAQLSKKSKEPRVHLMCHASELALVVIDKEILENMQNV